MAISSLGVGSGLDLGGIISSLMQVEQQPLLAMQKKEASFQARISALGSLKGNLSALQNAANSLTLGSTQTAATKFSTLKATTGDTTIASASATSSAIAASYTLTNITLAKNEQIRKSGADFTIPATGNNGTLSIKVGSGVAVDVTVTGGSSLGQIATAINASTAGVIASIINDGTNDHLVITAKSSGSANTISINGSDGLGGTAWDSFDFQPAAPITVGGVENAWTGQQAATSAEVYINGLKVTSDSNTISSAITGVSITLLKESVGGTSLGVTADNTATLTASLTSFVSAFNTAAKSMKELGAYNAETKVAGALQGESVLRSAQSQVRELLRTKSDGTSAYNSFSDIGITLQADGTLKLDTTKLNAAIAADFAGVATLVDTVGRAFKTGLDSAVGSAGNLTSATDSANRMIKEIQKRQQALTLRLEQVQARYVKQFSALDGMVASMNQTSNWLTQQLASLPGASTS